MPLLDEIPPPELQKNFSNSSRGRSGNPNAGPLQPPRNGPRHYNDANKADIPTPQFGGRKSTTPPPNNDEFYQSHDFIPFPDDQAEPGSKTPPTQNYYRDENKPTNPQQQDYRSTRGGGPMRRGPSANFGRGRNNFSQPQYSSRTPPMHDEYSTSPKETDNFEPHNQEA